MDKIQVIAIAAKTNAEYMKGKLLSIVAFLVFILVAITYVSVQFTYGIPLRVCVDVSLGMTSILLNGLSVFLGANLIKQEIETRTIYTVLSCSCSRETFLMGKLVGLSLSQLICWFILLFVSLVMLMIVSGSIPTLFISAYVMIYFEASLLLILALFLSLYYDSIMTTFLTIMIYLAGYGLDSTISLSGTQANPMLLQTLKVIRWILPNFSLFDFKQHVLYETLISLKQQALITAYYLLASLFLCIIGRNKFQKMDIQ
jgi:ABC-2 type transport system permease protein